jgi:methionyl-tRNA formyltransferase
MATVIFAGTSDFSTHSLVALAKEHDVLHVFSQPDKPVGRKQEMEETPVKKLCKELNLECSQPEKIADDPFWENPPEFDFLITASYGQMIPEKILKLAQKDALNVHGSLLPKYRGASPVQEALLNGDQITGVSLMRMVKKMDAGDVFLQQEVAIHPESTYESLYEKLAKVGADVLLKTLETYKAIRPLPQGEEDATYCRKISRADGEISWNAPAFDIFNKCRAFTPWPGVFTFLDGKRLKLLKVSHVDDEHKAEHGLVYKKDDDVLVACGGHSALVLKEAQLEGKNPMEIGEFLKGQDGFIGSVLG